MFDIDEQHLQKRYQEILLESPMVGGRTYGDILDHRDLNYDKTKDVIDNDELIDSIKKIASIDLDVYRRNGHNYKIYHFVSKEPVIRCYFILKEYGNGVQNGGVWQRREDGGLAREIVFNYMLNKWEYFISDSNQYLQGQEFWRKLLERALRDDYKVGVISKLENKEYDYRDIDFNNYFGVSDFYSNFLIKLYSK